MGFCALGGIILSDKNKSEEDLINGLIQLKKHDFDMNSDLKQRSHKNPVSSDYILCPKDGQATGEVLKSVLEGEPATISEQILAPNLFDLTNSNTKTILDIIPVTIILLEAVDGKISYVNKHGRELYAFGLTEKNLPEVNMAKMKFFNPDGSQILFDGLPVNGTLKFGEENYHKELLVENADGKRLPILFNSIPLYDEQGSIKGAVVTMEDMSERKWMEAVLRASVEKYRPVIKTANEGIFMFDTAGKIVFANEMVARCLDLHVEEMLGKSIFEFVQKENLDAWILHDWDRKANISERYELKFRKKSGDDIWLLVGDTMLYDEQGDFEGVLVAVWDIAVRKETEKQLTFQAKLLSSICEAVLAVDTNGQLIYWNETAQTITGWSGDEIIGLTVEDLLKKLSIDVPSEEISTDLQKKGYLTRELAVCRKDGVWVYVDLHFKQIFAPENGVQWTIVSFRDVTKQKETLLKLMEEEKHLLEIIDSSSEGSFFHDFVKDEMYYSSAWKKRLGIEHLSPKQIAKAAATYVHPDDKERVLNTSLQLIKQKINKAKIEFRIKTVDLGYIWILFQGKIVYDEEGRPIKCFGTYMDITTGKQAEGALLAGKATALDLVDKLRQTDQNKNRFLATLSHELRNPLAVIVMGISLLQHLPLNEPKAKQIVETINRQVVQLSHLVDDLLEVTRVAQNKIILKKEHVILNDLVEKIVEDYRPRFADKGVHLTTEFLTESIHLEADPVRLVQVLDNLLHNAHHFTKNGEETFVSINRDDSKQEAVITVRDTGVGIRPELLANLFQPFVQVGDSHEQGHGGLGLGLVVSKGLVELHGGRMSVFSGGVGKGTEFTIWLPICRALDGKREKPLLNHVATQCLWRILMIEDNEVLSEIVCQLLGLLGHEAIAASSGQEGLTIAKKYKPEVILCDIGLPDIDGYEIAKNIRQDEDLKDIFLIAMSGYAQPEDLARTEAAGFDCHLAKPVDLDSLKKALDEIVD